MLQDLRFGLRTLAKSPGFSLVAVLVLALGIGINAAIFSIVNAVLFRPLPVRAPEELRYVYSKSLVESAPFGISYAEYVDLRDNNEVFSGLLGRSSRVGSLTAGGESAYAAGEVVSGTLNCWACDQSSGARFCAKTTG